MVPGVHSVPVWAALNDGCCRRHFSCAVFNQVENLDDECVGITPAGKLTTRRLRERSGACNEGSNHPGTGNCLQKSHQARTETSSSASATDRLRFVAAIGSPGGRAYLFRGSTEVRIFIVGSALLLWTQLTTRKQRIAQLNLITAAGMWA